VLFSTWHGVQDLAGPLTQDSRNPVGSSEVQVLKLEEEVVDCMYDPVELAQAPPAPQVFLAQPLYVSVRVLEHFLLFWK